MDKERLSGLLSLNQLSLTAEEEERVTAYFSLMESEEKKMEAADTESLSPMVHVNDIKNILRDDVCIKDFSRDELQKSAPEKMDGYWQVPRLVE